MAKLKIDKDYIEMRNSLIPVAVSKANKELGATRGIRKAEEWSDAWNREFHTQMEKLVKQCIDDCTAGWIIGAEACRAYINVGSWDSAKRWIKRYEAPLRYWIDGRPVFLKVEIDRWLKANSGAECGK